MRESWTDARMDDLNGKVDELGRRVENGFNRVGADLRELRQETKTEFTAVRGEMKVELGGMRNEMNERLEGLENRLAAMHRLMIQFCGLALTALVGLIATQI